MKLLRHTLFALLLLLAQTGALTHAFEHLRADADATASHACALCITAQGLDAPFASTPPDSAPSAANFAPPAGVMAPAFSVSPVSPRARAPPVA